MSDLTGRRARFDDHSWFVDTFEWAGLLTLTSPHARERPTFSAAELSQPPQRVLFDQSTGLTQRARDAGRDAEFWWKPVTWDDDPNKATNPTMRFRAADVDCKMRRVPFKDLDQPVEVRLRGREAGGSVSLVSDGDRLVAYDDGARFPVKAGDVVGDYLLAHSYAFRTFPIHRTRDRYWGLASGRYAPQSAVHDDPMAALQSYGLGVISSPEVMMTARRRSEVVRDHAQRIRALAPGVPIIVRQPRFEDHPGTGAASVPDYALFGRILSERARAGWPVDLIVSRGQLGPRWSAEFSEAGVGIHERHWVHDKSIATSAWVLIDTGAFHNVVDPEDKIDFSVDLPRPQSELYYQRERLITLPGDWRREQLALVMRLAKLGVGCNDPDIGAGYASRGLWACSRGAQRFLEWWAREFASPQYMALLVDQARKGTTVHATLGDVVKRKAPIQPSSLLLARWARQMTPSMRLTIDQPVPAHRPWMHFNALIVDRSAGILSTIYPWSDPLAMSDVTEIATETSVVFGDRNLVTMLSEIERALNDLGPLVPCF